MTSRNAIRRKPRLLFVDDEKRVLNSMRAMFRRDYDLYLTTRGDEALEIVGQHAIDVVVADQRMPVMSGVQVLSAVRQRSPATVRILLTGYADLDAIEGAMNDGEVFRFLSKPCATDELRGTISQAVTIARDTGDQAHQLSSADADSTTTTGEIEKLRTPSRAAARRPRVRANVGMPVAVPPMGAAVAPPRGTGQTRDGAVAAAPGPTATSAELAKAALLSDDPSPTPTPEPSALPPEAPVPTLCPPSEVSCVGQGKHNISVLVFTRDGQFARAVGRALSGSLYTFHATSSQQVIDGIANVAPAVLIADVSIDPDEIRTLSGVLKQTLPALTTMVAGQHRDAQVMIGLINHGQVFRFIDKPLSSTACQNHVREALRRHVQLRKDPGLARRYAVSAPNGDDGTWARLGASVSAGLERVRRLWGGEAPAV